MAPEKKEGTVDPQPKKEKGSSTNIHTDPPISEKDELKKAEHEMRKRAKK